MYPPLTYISIRVTSLASGSRFSVCCVSLSVSMRKKKGVTPSLADFAEDAHGNSSPPHESKGIYRLDSSRPLHNHPASDRWSTDRPSGDRPMRSDRPREEVDRPSHREDDSRVDEPADWRSSERECRVPRERPSTGESFRSSRARDFPDADEGTHWRDLPRKNLPASSVSGGTVQPTYSSFGRSRDSKAAPDNWRDQLSGSRNKPETATGCGWKPTLSRTPFASQPVAQKKTELGPAAEKKTPMSRSDEKEQPQIEKPKQVKDYRAFTTVADLKTNISLQKAPVTQVNSGVAKQNM